MKITFDPIGIVHSPFNKLEEMPIQPSGSRETRGKLEIYPPYGQALQDLDGFSHLIAIYYFHKSKGWKPIVTPFLDKHEHGLFSTRAPKRPNPIGLSVLKILEIKSNKIFVQHIDILDGTPLLDIKPYVPQFDAAEDVHIGWLTEHIRQVKTKKSDKRFTV